MRSTLSFFSFLVILFLMTACNEKQVNYLNESEEAKQERLSWWKDAKFGMFIHWGLYAVPAGEYKGEKVEGIGEWIMNSSQIPIDDYKKFADEFNPVEFDADEWVSLAKEAGMKYLVITSKHHDGFCLWDTEYTEYNIVDATPYGKDILMQLSAACKKHDVRLGFYYSIMDWHHPDAQAIFEPNYNIGRKSGDVNPNFSRYVEEYMKPQLKELITKYDNVDILWFDGEWIPDYTTEMGKDIYNYLRNIKPDLIINNRVDKGRQGMTGMNVEGDFAGDFGTPEQEIPATGVEGFEWESCMTMNDTWGYKYFDRNWKSTEVLIHHLVDVVSKGGNYLLNVGPTAEGLIPEPSVKRLKDMGQWMDKHGETIYGTDPSPVDRPKWGRYTAKEDELYVHIFDWPTDNQLELQGIQNYEEARLLSDPANASVALEKSDGSLILQLPDAAPDTIASVIGLKR